MPQLDRTPEREASLVGLEVARFIAALGVLLWHYQHFYYTGTNGPNYQIEQQPLYWLLWPFYRSGFVAVPVFWSISGFIFHHKYAAPISTNRVSARRFWLLRFTRLYPLHFVTLLLVAALQWSYTAIVGSGFVYAHQDLRHFVLQLFLASSWHLFEKGPSYNGPIWSVSVEILIYAWFFGLRRFQLGKPPVLMLVVVITAMLSALKLADTPITRCICLFELGALLSVSYRWLNERFSLRTLQLTATALFLGATSCCVLVPALRRLPATVLSVPLAPLFVLFLLATVRPRSPRVIEVLTRLGNTTYSSYLIHFPLQLVIMLAVVHHPQSLPVQSPWFLAAFVVVVFILGERVYQLFEKPMQDLLRARFSSVHAQRAALEPDSAALNETHSDESRTIGHPT
jgi:peptidoglycan/LPS O-acetylase OafA/YrhL